MIVKSLKQNHMSYLANIFFLLVFLVAASARAAHTTADLFLAADTATPGTTVLAGIQMEMEPGWHTYWKNPGESGQATEIKWTLPPGVTAGEIQWPLPNKLPPAEVTTYGYEGKIILLVPLTLASNVSAGPVEITAKVSWLECKEACVPAKATLQATLQVGQETKPSASVELITAAKKNLPQPQSNLQLQAWWESPATNDSRSLIMTWSTAQLGGTGTPDSSSPPGGSDFYPAASEKFELQPGFENLATSTATVQWRKSVKKFEGEWPKEISGLLVFGTNETRTGVAATFPISEIIPLPNPAATTTAPAQSLWLMLLYAFIGGLILNIMPCVLPVIALKILGFVSESKSSPARVRALGGIYALGVLCSFLTLATLVIAVKAAGHQAGWGMQFGNPVFLVCLSTLVTLVALNLFGIFEVTLGGSAMNAAGNLSQKSGATGAFFNGVLATILATPCTAPYLSGALGFAFSQPPGIIILVFLTVGLGLASPYILLSWNPAWLKFLPRPGAWMEKFKIGMGFPMLATVVWLCYIARTSYGDNIFWLVGFLVVVAFAAWIYGEFFQRGRRGKLAAAIITGLLFAGGYVFILEKQLNWRAPVFETKSPGSLKESADGIDWQPWSPAAVASARAAGKIVFVDFTADWCLTCQFNKRTSIEITEVREKLKSLNAVSLIGDYTHFAPAITAELARFNRAGVPLVVVFPKNPATPPLVLPEILRPGIVLEALQQAGKS